MLNRLVDNRYSMLVIEHGSEVFLMLLQIDISSVLPAAGSPSLLHPFSPPLDQVSFNITGMNN